MYTHTHTHTHTYTHTHTHTHTRTENRDTVFTYTHTHTHTYTQEYGRLKKVLDSLAVEELLLVCEVLGMQVGGEADLQEGGEVTSGELNDSRRVEMGVRR